MGAAIELASGSRGVGDGVEFELTIYWHEAESRYGGLRSNFGALVQALNGGGRSTAGDSDHYSEAMDAGTSSMRRTWRKLRAMADRDMTAELIILFRLFGGVRRSRIHNMVSEKNGILVDMTEAAEAAREDLAALRADKAEPEVRDTRMRIVRKSESLFWERAPELEKVERQIAGYRSRILDLVTEIDEEQDDDKRRAKRDWRNTLRARVEKREAEAEELREQMWTAMMAADGDELRPVYATMAYADRTTSAIEAVEARLMSSESRESKDEFIGVLRAQCRELEVRARRAFVDIGTSL
jgi:hypothetical protein